MEPKSRPTFFFETGSIVRGEEFGGKRTVCILNTVSAIIISSNSHTGPALAAFCLHTSPIQRSFFLSTPSLHNYSFPYIKWLEDVNQRYKCASTSPSKHRPERNAGFRKNQEHFLTTIFFFFWPSFPRATQNHTLGLFRAIDTASGRAAHSRVQETRRLLLRPEHWQLPLWPWTSYEATSYPHVPQSRHELWPLQQDGDLCKLKGEPRQLTKAVAYEIVERSLMVGFFFIFVPLSHFFSVPAQEAKRR